MSVKESDYYTDYDLNALRLEDDTMPERLLDEDTNRTYVFEQDGVIAWSSLYHEEEVLDGLFVHPDHQSRGIGSKLLSKCEDDARRMGIDNLRIATVSEGANRFYVGNGYSIIKESVEIPAVNGDIKVECSVLVKSLNGG